MTWQSIPASRVFYLLSSLPVGSLARKGISRWVELAASALGTACPEPLTGGKLCQVSSPEVGGGVEEGRACERGALCVL